MIMLITKLLHFPRRVTQWNAVSKLISRRFTRNRLDFLQLAPIRRNMRAAMPEKDVESQVGVPWATHLQAISLEAPDHLLRNLTDVIVSCGGWILSRSATDTGIVTILFEFERLACVDVYSGLVGVGLELSRAGHLRLTQLCQCTRSSMQDRESEIASIELEIRTYPLDITASGSRPEPGIRCVSNPR
jgi:hypothetical protein